MANWANPLLTTQYDVFLSECKDRDVDSGTMFLNSPVNPPVGCVRFNRTTKIFEEWNGTSWVALILAIAGGGTGAATGAGAGTALGLGTMAYQNSNAVSITGGSIQSITILHLSCSPLPQANLTYDLGGTGNRWRNVWCGSGLVVPVGVDKYVVG